MRSILCFVGLACVVACGSKHATDFTDGGNPDDDSGGILDPDADIFGGEAGDASTCVPDPGNFDVPGNNCDDDGDGKVDNGPADCDTGSLMLTGDAYAMAKSIGLCPKSNGTTTWGVITAAYTQGYMNMMPPDMNQHGIMNKFGNKLVPRDGKSMGLLSSGWAREYDQCNGMGPFKGGCSMTGMGTAPPGFPKAAQGCTIDNTANDVAVLSLKIKVPNNAKGLAFDFNFFSGEWPEFVCTTFNDSFIAYLKSSAFNNGMADNISFDSMKNPVSVNNSFFDRCSPANATTGCAGGQMKTAACKGGDSELQGTGFYDLGPHMYCGPNPSANDSGGGGTGWLTTQAPVKPGETIILEFYVFDVGDQIYDSSVLLDKFIWLATDTTTGTIRPPN
jgi:hypothetical protein